MDSALANWASPPYPKFPSIAGLKPWTILFLSYQLQLSLTVKDKFKGMTLAPKGGRLFTLGSPLGGLRHPESIIKMEATVVAHQANFPLYEKAQDMVQWLQIVHFPVPICTFLHPFHTQRDEP